MGWLSKSSFKDTTSPLRASNTEVLLPVFCDGEENMYADDTVIYCVFMEKKIAAKLSAAMEKVT